jgi:hypothetical protein
MRSMYPSRFEVVKSVYMWSTYKRSMCPMWFSCEKNCCMIKLRCLWWAWHGTQYFQQLHIIISRGKKDGSKGNHLAKGPYILAHDLIIKDEN